MTTTTAERSTASPSCSMEMMTEIQTSETVISDCPIAAMCQSGSKSRKRYIVPFMIGILCILAGIAIIIEPRILVWLLAAIAIVVGAMFLLLAFFAYRFMNKQQPT